MGRFFAVIIALAGLMVAYVAISEYREQQAAMVDWVRGEGVVLGIEPVFIGVGGRGNPSFEYNVLVQFADETGAPVSGKYRQLFNILLPGTGDRISLIHDPKNPLAVHGADWRAQWFDMVFKLAFAGLLLVIGAWLASGGKARRQAVR